MYEAFTDPKTWMFALFSALNNVPNSLSNQSQLIVVSFGFTNLQTTLLSCVDGVIEIVTIWTGVTLAARIPNSIAWVGIIYFVPNVLGVLLITLLPWDNKIGLLFAEWLNGTICLQSIIRHTCIKVNVQILAQLDSSLVFPGSQTSPLGTPNVSL
jgi:MFS transporter, ACS family, allantoate permease